MPANMDCVNGWTIPFITPCTISRRLTVMGCIKGPPRTTVNDPANKNFRYMVLVFILCVLVILRQAIPRIPYNPESAHINLTHVTDFQSGVLAK